MENSLFELFTVPVTAYSLAIFFAAVLCIAAMVISNAASIRKTLSAVSLTALPLAVAGARAFYCIVNYDVYIGEDFVQVLRIWEGGCAIWGAIGGVLLAAFIVSRFRHVRLSVLLDAMAPSGALMVALSRFAEWLSGQGYGKLVENESFMFFPAAVPNEWDEWHWAIFMLEGLYALIILFILLRSKGTLPDGGTARLFMVLYCSGQIFLENLRCDTYLAWVFGYLRVSQLTCVLVLLGMLISACCRESGRQKVRRMPIRHWTVTFALFIFLAGVIVGMEFAIDKLWWMPNWACYLIILVVSVLFGMMTYRNVIRYKGKE